MHYKLLKWMIVLFLFVVALLAIPSLYGMIQIRACLDSGDSAILVLGGSDGSRERHAFALANAFDRLMSQPNLNQPLLITEDSQSETANSHGQGDTYSGATSPGTSPASQAKPLTQHNAIRIWISTGRPRPEISRLANQSGIGLSRVELDYRAIDTVTNFTTMAPKMRAANISTVYVVTDVSHIDRAMIIARAVLAYYGITPVAAPCPNTTRRDSEWIIRGWRDYLRCVVWFYTGKSGANMLALRRFSYRLGYKIQRYNPF